jgi:hypothetical protein
MSGTPGASVISGISGMHDEVRTGRLGRETEPQRPARANSPRAARLEFPTGI